MPFSNMLVRLKDTFISNYHVMINFLPNDKILDRSKLKAFADDKINVLKMMIFVFDRDENIVGKGENAGYQHFLLFPQCFHRAFLPRVVRSRDCLVKS